MFYFLNFFRYHVMLIISLACGPVKKSPDVSDDSNVIVVGSWHGGKSTLLQSFVSKDRGSFSVRVVFFLKSVATQTMIPCRRPELMFR